MKQIQPTIATYKLALMGASPYHVGALKECKKVRTQTDARTNYLALLQHLQPGERVFFTVGPTE